MDSAARLSTRERALLFERTAELKNLTSAVVEKDFWVCWTLGYLFGISEFRKSLAFKGGTSLSKAYGLINRFSEDLDLVLDWRVLGYEHDAPLSQTSGKQEKRLLKEMVAKRNDFIAAVIVPVLVSDFAGLLDESFGIGVDPTDPAVILFDYPKTILDKSIDQRLRLEIGHRSAMMPRSSRLITSYCAEEFPDRFSQRGAAVDTIDAKRTFFEKLLILYKEANRIKGIIPGRYSRHYYDVYMMAQSSIAEQALAEPQLFDDVVAFTKLFFPAAWARYDEASLANIKLMPPALSVDTLAADYRAMRSMFFSEPPVFEDILEGIKNLEKRVRSYNLGRENG